MLVLFLQSQWRLACLIARGVWPPARGGASRRPGRVVRITLFGGLLWIYSLLQWLGLLLDELLFPGYRKITVRQPWFVLGIPRSGTTFVHGVLADDPRMTTFSTWECFAAPSISARYLLTWSNRLDRRLGRPLGRLGAWAGRRWLGALEDRHPVRLSAPEEDFFSLLPLASCFALIAAFPDGRDLWRMAELDRPEQRRFAKRQLRYYRAMLQRHLHFHGPDKQLLSKNASFAGSAQRLDQTFPDARFIVCFRDPDETLSSQISTLEPALELFGSDDPTGSLRERLSELFFFYYSNLLDFQASQPKARCACLFADQLDETLDRQVLAIYERFGHRPDPAFCQRLEERAEAAGRHQSPHQHSLADSGLDPDRIDERFAPIKRRLSELRRDLEEKESAQ